MEGDGGGGRGRRQAAAAGGARSGARHCWGARGAAAAGPAREAGQRGDCPGASSAAAAAAGGEMIAELLSSALGLALYLNTLGADFCYDDR